MNKELGFKIVIKKNLNSIFSDPPNAARSLE